MSIFTVNTVVLIASSNSILKERVVLYTQSTTWQRAPLLNSLFRIAIYLEHMPKTDLMIGFRISKLFLVVAVVWGMLQKSTANAFQPVFQNTVKMRKEPTLFSEIEIGPTKSPLHSCQPTHLTISQRTRNSLSLFVMMEGILVLAMTLMLNSFYTVGNLIRRLCSSKPARIIMRGHSTPSSHSHHPTLPLRISCRDGIAIAAFAALFLSRPCRQ